MKPTHTIRIGYPDGSDCELPNLSLDAAREMTNTFISMHEAGEIDLDAHKPVDVSIIRTDTKSVLFHHVFV